MTGSEILKAIEGAGAADQSSWSPAERFAHLVDLFETRALLDALILRLVGEASQRTGTT